MAYNKKAHLRDNIEAIRLMFRLEKEQRTATPEEAGILAAYSGFGGIKAVLSPFGKLTDILRWTQADRELFPLITELHNVLRDGAADEHEYRRLVESVKASTFTAFYTPSAIVNAIASSLGEHGVSPGRFLDPSSGTGNFVSAFRPQCHSASGNTPEIVAYEKDLLTGRILARLHPEAQVNIKGFEELPPHRNGYFDVVSSNIPFGDIRVFDPSFDNGTARRFALNSLHNYFFAKGLDAVREGGVLAFITSQGGDELRYGLSRKAIPDEPIPTVIGCPPAQQPLYRLCRYGGGQRPDHLAEGHAFPKGIYVTRTVFRGSRHAGRRDDAERVFRAYRRHRAYTWPCRYRSLRQAGTHLPA